MNRFPGENTMKSFSVSSVNQAIAPIAEIAA